MDQIKRPQAWAVPGIVLAALPLPSSPMPFKDLVLEQLILRYGVTIEQIRGRWRGRQVIYVRQLFCFLMKQCYKEKVQLNWIANILDYKEHTAIIHNIESYKNRLETNDVMEEDSLNGIIGTKFATVREDFNHFKTILYKCITSLESLDELVQEKTP